MIPCSVLTERMGTDGWYIGGWKAGLDWSMEMNRLFCVYTDCFFGAIFALLGCC